MEAELVVLLSSLISSDRVFPDVAPQATPRPYCTYQQVGGTPIQYLSGGSGTGIARIQINVWSNTRAEATTVMRQIEQAVTGTPLYGGIEIGAISMYEEEQKLYGSRQDFSFKY